MKGSLLKRGITQPRPLEELIAEITCPVFGAFGENDHIISLDDVRRFRNCLEDKRKSYEIHVFKGAPHGWLNDTMPGRYRRPQDQPDSIELDLW